MIIFGECVYIGYSLKEVSEVKTALNNANIKYKEKTISHNNQYAARGTMRGSFGGMGISNKFDTQYEIIVKSKDFDKAKFIINSGNK